MGDLLLWSKDHRYGLSVREDLLAECVEECSRSSPQETGGIVVGYYTPPHDCAIVTALGKPPNDSIQRSGFFERGTSGIQRWLRKLWRHHRHYYIGEWHFHPGGASFPSQTDTAQMKVLSKDAKLKCPEPILLIIGGDPGHDWNVKAYVYPTDHGCVPLLGMSSSAES